MAELRVWLEGWEHHCCGDHREVGQEIQIEVLGGRYLNWEARHGPFSDDAPSPLLVTGRIIDILLHRKVMQYLGNRVWRCVGFLPGDSIPNTDGGIDAGDLEFVLQVEDSVPLSDRLVKPVDPPRRDCPILVEVFERLEGREPEEEDPFWYGWDESENPIALDVSPVFPDALTAIDWWTRYTGRIVANLGVEGERVWAGTDLDANPGLPLFNRGDARATSETTVLVGRSHQESREHERARDAEQQIRRDCQELRQRRLSRQLSIEELASRSGLDVEVLEHLELGETDGWIEKKDWLALVWALTDPWPEARDAAARRGPVAGLFSPTMSPLQLADSVVRSYRDSPESS